MFKKEKINECSLRQKMLSQICAIFVKTKSFTNDKMKMAVRKNLNREIQSDLEAKKQYMRRFVHISELNKQSIIVAAQWSVVLNLHTNDPSLNPTGIQYKDIDQNADRL